MGNLVDLVDVTPARSLRPASPDTEERALGLDSGWQEHYRGRGGDMLPQEASDDLAREATAAEWRWKQHVRVRSARRGTGDLPVMQQHHRRPGTERLERAGEMLFGVCEHVGCEEIRWRERDREGLSGAVAEEIETALDIAENVSHVRSEAECSTTQKERRRSRIAEATQRVVARTHPSARFVPEERLGKRARPKDDGAPGKLDIEQEIARQRIAVYKGSERVADRRMRQDHTGAAGVRCADEPSERGGVVVDEEVHVLTFRNSDTCSSTSRTPPPPTAMEATV